MEKDPANRYQSAQEMLEAIEAFKRNPSVRFEYEYRNTQDNPERNINRVVNSTKPAAKRRLEPRQRLSPAATSAPETPARVGTAEPRPRQKAIRRRKARSLSRLLPIFFGMAVAFVIGAAILIYLIFTNSSNLLFSNRDDVTIISFVGMTRG